MAKDSRLHDVVSIEFRIAGKDIGPLCYKFEWVCFMNAGHRVTAAFYDSQYTVINDEIINFLLRESKTDHGIDAEVIIHLSSTHNRRKTTKRKFKVLSFSNNTSGTITNGTLELVCIDQASWLLNKGKCSGKAYKGNVTKVIKDVINEHAPELKVTVDETLDNKHNYWYDMRLDPKTFILSLLEWSSTITARKTPLVVHTQDDEFKCREWSTLPPTKTNNKRFYIVNKTGELKEWSDRGEIQILNNSLLSPVATKLYTSRISAVTGLYIDKNNKILSPEQVMADDETTTRKWKIGVGPDQSFKKPLGESSTFIEAVPEHNNGDVGLKYQDYAIGRARDWFIKTLYTTLRVKLTIEPIDTDFDDIYACGRDRIILEARTLDPKPHYIDGPWMLYGFRHLWSVKHYITEVMLCRIDYDAIGVPI